MRLLPSLLLLAACSEAPPLRQPPAPSGSDASQSDPGFEQVQVGHERELRGIWLTTVWNIDFPTSSSMSQSAQREELLEILDTVQAAGFNAIFFQVRPEGDAVYASSIEPWSRFLSGTSGQDPGYDPLELILQEGHARNLEVHAWINPYRAKVTASLTMGAGHISVTHPEAVVTYGNNAWMDPGQEVVQDRLIDVIEDLVTRYDLDGIHFDDYFYPYPISGTPFPDSATYSAYQSGGGTLSLEDWRRDNVNIMVQRVHEVVRDLDPTVRFGISPFGIYRPGQPPGILGLDAYAALYADPVHWSEQGWVDYLAPQLYWPSTQTNQAFSPLIDWWSDLGDGRHHTFAGLYLSQLGETSAWTLDEFEIQTTLSAAHRSRGSKGNIWFSYRPIHTDRQEVRDFLATRIYPQPALTPAFGDRSSPVEPPRLVLEGATLSLDHDDPLRAFGIYAPTDAGWDLHQIVPASNHNLDLAPGRWAVTAVHRDGHESVGLVVEIE
ncbi:MAG: hypothetical protein EA397_14960 [Deltaproteobacteria bacterium]|nr:MAG: hypothetical protein EA397_14960 [Deltaproteobacteria bacterium]